jgi:hypothetical protein
MLDTELGEYTKQEGFVRLGDVFGRSTTNIEGVLP